MRAGKIFILLWFIVALVMLVRAISLDETPSIVIWSINLGIWFLMLIDPRIG